MTALKRSQRASAESGGASARERRRCRPSVVLAHALASHTAHVLNSEPHPVPCLWLRPCNGVRLPGGSAGDLTHWDLSTRVCQPLGPLRSRTLFLLLLRASCACHRISSVRTGAQACSRTRACSASTHQSSHIPPVERGVWTAWLAVIARKRRSAPVWGSGSRRARTVMRVIFYP